MALLQDIHGRKMRKLRIGVTDRCNFRCIYCMPEEVTWLEREEILRFEEIVRLAKIFSSLGVRKIRLTGGEPLMRKNLPLLILFLKRIPGIESISITTNGYLFASYAEEMRKAGLDSVNFSLDTLRRDRFKEICQKDALDRVLESITLAKILHFSPVKVNCVVIRGFNEDEIKDFLEWAIAQQVIVRFIEFMPFDGKGMWNHQRVFSMSEILQEAEKAGKVELLREIEPQAARRFFFSNSSGGCEFGIIPTITAPFCSSCDRLRITADGTFLNCLFQPKGVDLKTPLREGKSDEEISEIIRQAVWDKPFGYLLLNEKWKAARAGMYAIGG
ncbi:MAG: GTP 3',8-cyclase MoaA [bacterium JZ-2024 1]